MRNITLESYIKFLEYSRSHSFRKIVFEYSAFFCLLFMILISLIIAICAYFIFKITERITLIIVCIFLLEGFLAVTAIVYPSNGRKNLFNKVLMRFF